MQVDLKAFMESSKRVMQSHKALLVNIFALIGGLRECDEDHQQTSLRDESLQ